jgi:hypothetical protein
MKPVDVPPEVRVQRSVGPAIGGTMALLVLATCSNGAPSVRTACGPEVMAATAGGGDGWIPLFNGTDLTGWTPSAGAEGLFAAATLDGEPVIHVYPTQEDQSTQPQATLRTNEAYGNYVFHLEYKWGTKRYSDRKQTARDSGICFHLCNDLGLVWPDSLELQIGSSPLGQDWITGDIFVLGATKADWKYRTTNDPQASPETCGQIKLGAGEKENRGRVAQQLDKADDWNIIELTVHGATDAEYNVNGTVLNRLYNFECNTGGSWMPAERGPIAVQAEFAELYFRNIKIKPLP